MINDNSQDVQKLYIAYFGRPADPSGINYWLSLLKQSFTLKDISNELSIQEEYTRNIPNDQVLESQINKLYVNLFDRKSDFEGLNYWLRMVDKEGYEISDILYYLLYLFHLQ